MMIRWWDIAQYLNETKKRETNKMKRKKKDEKSKHVLPFIWYVFVFVFSCGLDLGLGLIDCGDSLTKITEIMLLHLQLSCILDLWLIFKDWGD